MKITDIDKRRAIKRLQAFKKDNARYNRLKTENRINQFKIDFLKKWGYEFEAILYADDVARHRHDTPAVEAVTRITDDPYITIYRGEEKSPTRLTGESLYLKVTLEGKSETQLVADFKRIIKPYRDLLEANTSKERNRKTDIPEGIWPIYDLYLKESENMVKTTRQWFNVSGNPAPLPNNDEFDEKLLKQIQTAVSNAKAIIDAVMKEYALKQ